MGNAKCGTPQCAASSSHCYYFCLGHTYPHHYSVLKTSLGRNTKFYMHSKQRVKLQFWIMIFFFDRELYQTSRRMVVRCRLSATACSLYSQLSSISGGSLLHSPLNLRYEGVSKSFRAGLLERELQMVQPSATGCSCIAIL
jgi:hypothetical protein